MEAEKPLSLFRLLALYPHSDGYTMIVSSL